jgi:hypothetical protein
MKVPSENTTLPEASLFQDVQACIARQQKLAETLEALGHPRQARQAREMLATWVKSWLSLAVELESAQAFLGALSDVPDELIPVSTEE